ncbi:nuclear protein MDM1 isoform X2 [Melanotaenia boesemani]|uniref:nuclear protein MDM1 isoform X2 n=1 Tax=Melanotaenia boesemani TaxID=1250792 RepID=UPI001C0473CA|nr:nuclear protein MDM1 isoform X2 [Melanotaenia boesemani]
MTVRFKCQSEYQKSYRVPRSRSMSPQHSAPLAGLRSDQMGISREPVLQRRRRLGPLGAAQSCSSLLCPPDVQQQSELDTRPRKKSPSAASRSHSAHRKEPPPPAAPADSESPPEPATPAGPRPAADSGPPERLDPGSSAVANGKSVKPRPSQPDNQPQPSSPEEQLPPSVNKVDKVLQWRAGLRPSGHRSGIHRSEYHKQFGWKNPLPAESPLLTAEQVLYSSNRSVPPFKTNPVSMETEYRQSFQGVIPTTRTCLRKHLEHERVPLFHTQTTNRRRKEEAQKKSSKEENPRREGNRSLLHLKATSPHPHRMLTEYESSFRSPLCRNPDGGESPDPVSLQMKELKQKAQSYRHRAWGTNFSRVHLGQLTSEHNTLWEPTDTTDSHISLSTPRLTSSHSPEPNSSSCVEALDLASNSSKRSSVVGDGQTHHTHKKTQRNPETKQRSSPGLLVERRTAWEEEENTDEEQGRLPTPRLKTRPVQRTHHDLTTPATGGALLVGNLKPADDSSPHKQQRCGSAVSLATGDDIAINMSTKHKEAWSENSPTPSNPSPDHKPTSLPPSKPIRMKHTSHLAPPPPLPSSLHGIQGTLRHPDFQHNGELGLRFREQPCSGGGCGSDEDDRLSVMSWRSAASCSAASAILERAQKRRENFWGKR